MKTTNVKNEDTGNENMQTDRQVDIQVDIQGDITHTLFVSVRTERYTVGGVLIDV